MDGKVNNSDNGFDLLSFSPNKTNPTSAKIFESKPLNGTSVVLDGTNNGPQLGDNWTNSNISLMLKNSDMNLKQTGTVLDKMMKNNLIERYVVTVDKELKQVIIFKMDNF